MPENMHVAIQEPISCRKKILETAIDVIRDLKKCERLKQLKKEKIVYYGHLRKNIRELKTLISQLDYLPKVKIKEPAPVKKHRLKTSPKKPKHLPKVKKEVSKLDRDIAALKERIKSL